MKLRSIALSSLMVAMATGSMATVSMAIVSMTTKSMAPKAQADKGGAVTMSWISNTCAIRMCSSVNFEGGGTGLLVAGDSNPVFLSFANALFNPREYTIGRTATINTMDAAGRSTHSMTVSPPESFSSIIGAGQIAGITGGAVAGRTISANQVHHNSMSRVIVDELVPFFASTDSYMLRLPPAVSAGTVDPIGQILCVVKTKTKSNNPNDRTYVLPEVADEIAAQNVRILLQGGDGKGQQEIAPISMGALKLTKADSGRALDASIGGKEMKIQSWVKDCYDKRMMLFDPSLTNVLQFDVSNDMATKLSAQFPAGQGMRVKVKFPWLCDAECALSEPISKTWILPVSSTMSRVSIMMNSAACRVLPTVNK